MDMRTGHIYTPEQLKEMFDRTPEVEKFVVPMNIAPTVKQMLRKPPRVAYNEPCPCGSGKLFRKCCFSITRRRGV
jgi:uncharacterized protein YecA (UPF0149 family)